MAAADQADEAPAPPAPRRRRRRPLAWAFALLVIVVALAGLLAARLAAGPVSLTWAIPLIEWVLADETGPVDVGAATATLDWRDWQQGPTLGLGEVTATSPKFKLSIRALSVAVSSDDLLAGEIALRRLMAREAELTMPLPAASATAPADDRSGDGLNAFLRPPEAGPLAELQVIDVDDVRITLTRGGGDPAWQGRIESARISRGTAGFDGTAVLGFDQDGAPATANLTFAGDPVTRSTNARLGFEGLRLDALAPVVPALAPVAALELPLSGSIDATLDGEGRAGAFSVSATGGNGALILSPALAKRIGTPAAAQRLAVRDLTLQASGDPAGDTWAIDALTVSLAEGAVLRLPEPLDLALPLRRIEAAGRLAGTTLTVDHAGLVLDGGVKIGAHATIEDPFTAARGDVEATLAGATIADVRRYWPKAYGKDAYEWINEHLTAGAIGDARLQATVAAENGTPSVSGLAMTIPVEGAVIDYLPPLPPIRNGSAVVSLDLDSLRVAVSRGNVGGLAIAEGRVAIPDLNKDIPSIDIDVRTSGPAAAALGILATPRFDFLAGTGITGSQADGSVDARIRLAFPLLDELELEQMDIAVTATTSGLAVPNVYDGLALTDGNINFDVTEDGLRARGPLRFAGVDGILDWEEDFLPATPLHTDLVFNIVRADVAEVRRGLARWVKADRWLKKGHFAGDVRYTARDDGTASIDGRIDLTAAEVALPELHWHKPAGRAALAEASAALLGGRLEAINRLALSASDADIRGYALFDNNGRLDSVDFDRFQLGRTRVAGNLRAINDRGWALTVYGQALDLKPFVTAEAKVSETAEEAGKAAASETGGGLVANLTVSADLQTVWLGTEEPLRAVLVTLDRTDADWRLVQVQAETAGGAPISLALVPAADGTSRVTASASDAGATLAGFGVLSTRVGGTLEADGRLETLPDGHRLTGELMIRSFRLVRAPLLARLLEVLALTGLRDLLTGRGMSFWAMHIPFEESDGVIDIRDARVAGPSLGLTGSGLIDLDADAIDLRGTVVPFYWANSLVGSLPLLGPLLTGGAEGGGLFSASYRLTGPLGQPVLNVNPYSIVLPSVVRYLLELIQSWITPPQTRTITP